MVNATRMPALMVLALATLLSPGCQPAAPQAQPVPAPLSLLLPQEIRIHPFTGTRTFDERSGAKGLEVRIEAIDGFGDANKAFGEFRFELYAYKPNSLDPKGPMIAAWPESLTDPQKNLLHWSSIQRAYIFKLQSYEAIPSGRRFVLRAVFSSPYTERLFDEHVFVAGQ